MEKLTLDVLSDSRNAETSPQNNLQVKVASVQLIWSRCWIIKVIPKAVEVHVPAAGLLALDYLMTGSKKQKLFARAIF